MKLSHRRHDERPRFTKILSGRAFSGSGATLSKETLDLSEWTQITVARGRSPGERGKAKLGVVVVEDCEKKGRTVGVKAGCASLCVMV